MGAIIIKWVIVFLALSNFGYMAFDGTRALIKGDYIRPRSGNYAGQLGPWSKLVSKVGIRPESTMMKFIFLLYGLAGITIAICFILNVNGASTALLVINLLSIWYLIPGTVSSSLQVILLLVRKTLTS